jgi:hypothetical protein
VVTSTPPSHTSNSNCLATRQLFPPKSWITCTLPENVPTPFIYSFLSFCLQDDSFSWVTLLPIPNNLFNSSKGYYTTNNPTHTANTQISTTYHPNTKIFIPIVTLPSSQTVLDQSTIAKNISPAVFNRELLAFCISVSCGR